MDMPVCPSCQESVKLKFKRVSCGMSLIFVTSVIKRYVGDVVIAGLLFSRLYFSLMR